MFIEFDILRQSFAFYIILYSLKYFYTKPKMFFVLNIFGAFFHVSALIFIFLYYVFKLRISRKYLIFLLVFYSLSNFTPFSIINSIIKILSKFYPQAFFMSKILCYSLLNENSSFGVANLIYLFFLGLLILNFEKIKQEIPFIRIYLHLFAFFIMINSIFSSIKVIADRLSYFFYFGIAFIFIYTFQFINKYKVMVYFYFGFILCFPFIRFNRVISIPITKIVDLPYRNYFFVDDIDDARILHKRMHKDEIIKNGKH